MKKKSQFAPGEHPISKLARQFNQQKGSVSMGFQCLKNAAELSRDTVSLNKLGTLKAALLANLEIEYQRRKKIILAELTETNESTKPKLLQY